MAVLIVDWEYIYSTGGTDEECDAWTERVREAYWPVGGPDDCPPRARNGGLAMDQLIGMAAKADALVERLKAFYSEDAARLWMCSTHEAFGCTPADMIVLGKAGEVEAEIQRLESGAYV